MSQFDRDLGLGDVIKAYHAGYHVVTDVKRRFVTASLLATFPKIYSHVGQEINSIISYRQILTSKYKVSKSKKVKSCDAAYCEKMTKDYLIRERDHLINKIEVGFNELFQFLP